MRCDVCNKVISEGEGQRIAPAALQRLLDAGFGIDSANVEMLTSAGMPREQAVAMLRDAFLESNSDWVLCKACAVDARKALQPVVAESEGGMQAQPPGVAPESRHEALVQRWNDGQLLVGIERAFARDLFLRMPTAEFFRLTGEKPRFEKSVVWLAFVGSCGSLIGSLALLIPAGGWWSIALIPITLFWWCANLSMSVRGRSTMAVPSVAVVVALALHWSGALGRSWITRYLALFACSLWLGRLIYCASTEFLRNFVMRNERAMSAFAAGVTIRE